MVKNQGTNSVKQRILGDCWQWKANGRCSKGDNCSFRHDINKRVKSTQSNLLQGSSTRQKEERGKCTENQKSQRQKSQWKNVSIALQGLPQRNLQQVVSVKNGILQYACSTSRRMGCTARLKNRLAKGLKKNGDKSAVAVLKMHEQHQRTGRPVLDAYSTKCDDNWALRVSR